MTTTVESAQDVGGRRARTMPWYTFGLANLAVVGVLGLVSWYLVGDPEWSATGLYPQPLTAWMFWTIIAFVWVGFTFELSPFARLSQPWKGLAVAVVTGGLGTLITWLLAAGWGSVDASFAGTREDGAGYVLGSLIVLYSFVVYTMSAVNWGHWPWSASGLRQPWLGAASFGALAVPTLLLYVIFAVPSMATWAEPDAALLDPYTQIGFFYCVVVSSILTGAVLENWPWRLAGGPARTVLAAVVGNLVVGWVFYEALLGVAHIVLGSANVAALGETLPMFAAQVGVCWVFQVAPVHVPFHSPEFTAPANSYTIAPGIVAPRSRGSVRLLDATPGGELAIDPRYLAEDADVTGLLEGIALSRELGAARAFDDWRAREVLPGPGLTGPDELREFVARAASTYYHPAGTCAMGTGPDAVVDPRLGVRGLSGLRVADASIMPTPVSVNPNATVTVIGAKAAALMTGVEPPPVAAAVGAPVAAG